MLYLWDGDRKDCRSLSDPKIKAWKQEALRDISEGSLVFHAFFAFFGLK